MADTDTVVTPQSETVVTEPLKNDAQTVATNVIDPEQLKRERQEFMRAQEENRRLKAQIEADAKAKADADAKELEEQNQFKELYEQERAKREEVERATEAEKRAQAVKEATEKVLADFPDGVKAIASDTGLTLSDESEEAQAEFKAKLNRIQEHTGTQKVSANNPGTKSTSKQYTREELYVILNDPAKRDKYYREQGGVTAMMMTPES